MAPGPRERILDVGAGSGSVARRVLAASGTGELYAVDPDDKLVARARRDVPEVKSSVAGSEKLPFLDSYFDKVYTTMALHHFTDLDVSLKEISRVLKPGGFFVILDVEPGSLRGVLFRLLENAIMRRRMKFFTKVELAHKLQANGSFNVLQSAPCGSGYIIRSQRT